MGKECHAANAGKTKARECKAVETTGATAQNTHKQAKETKQNQRSKESSRKFYFYLLIDIVPS